MIIEAFKAFQPVSPVTWTLIPVTCWLLVSLLIFSYALGTSTVTTTTTAFFKRNYFY